MSFPRDEHRGETWTTSTFDQIERAKEGKTPPARCRAENRHGIPCNRIITVPWEEIPRVQNGEIVMCLEHRGGQLDGYVPSAERVAELTAKRRAVATERWKNRRAA